MGIERSFDDDKAALAELASSRDFVVRMVAAGLLGMLNFRDRAKAWGDTFRQKDGFIRLKNFFLEGWNEVSADISDLKHLPKIVLVPLKKIFMGRMTNYEGLQAEVDNLGDRIGVSRELERADLVDELRWQKRAKWMFLVYSGDDKKMLLERSKVKYLLENRGGGQTGDSGYLYEEKMDWDGFDLLLEKILAGDYTWELALVVLPDNEPVPMVLEMLGKICEGKVHVRSRTIGVVSARITGAIGMHDYFGLKNQGKVTVFTIPKTETSEISFQGRRQSFNGLLEFLTGDVIKLKRIVDDFAIQAQESHAR